MPGLWRTRWAAIGAAVAITLGAGGAFTAGALIETGERPVFIPITPCRLMDTRPASAVGPRTAALGPNETFTTSVRGRNGNCNIPADATAMVANVTIVAPTAGSYLTVSPADKPVPKASNLNWVANQAPTPNQVTADLSPDGKVKIYNRAGQVHVLVDIVGYFVHHRHDDRYYTEAEIDAAFEAAEPASEFTQNASWLFTFTPELTFPADTVTTDRAGIVMVSKMLHAYVSCPTAIMRRILYLSIDDVPIPSSAVVTTSASHLNTRLFGFTETSVAAGEHSIKVHGECEGAETPNGSGMHYASNTSVVVFPTD